MIGFWADFFTFLLAAVGLFLIFIIMLQRGKGGGLVGALGGMGGASAFGPKADIQVLKLTIGLAVAWVVIACAGIFFNRAYDPRNPTGDDTPGVKNAEKDMDDKGTDSDLGTSKDSKDKKPAGTGSEKAGPTKKAPAEKGVSAEGATPKKGAAKLADEAKPAKSAPKSEAKPAAEKPAEAKP